MASVDDRIVRMEFDNAAFEKKISTTLASIAQLDKALEFTTATKGLAGLSDATSKFNLTGIASAVENISSKFSALGVIGFTVIQNLTNHLLGFVKDIGGDIFGPIITGGTQRAKNIEQAKFMFEGLGIDIEAGMKSALDAVLGTAFGLDEAAKAAAQFGASGIQVGAEMTAALRGVAGAAAMTGTSFTEMADIFAGSAGTGRVTNIDLQQFATRGLNAAAAIGKVMGKTEAEIHQMAASGELDFKTFAAAMDQAFGAHATEANKTFTGALSNMHAAMSRLGAAIVGPQLTNGRDLFNALSPTIDKLTAALKPLIDRFTEITKLVTGGIIKGINSISFNNLKTAMPSLLSGFTNIFETLKNIYNVGKVAFLTIFPPGSEAIIVTIANAFNRLTEFIFVASQNTSRLRSIFQGIFSALSIGWEILKEGTKFIFNLASSLSNAAGAGGFFIKLADGLTDLQARLVKGGGIKDFFDSLTKALQKPIEFLQKIREGISNIFSGFSSAVAGQVTDSMGRIGDRFDNLKDVFSRIGDIWQPFENALKKIVGVLDAIWIVIRDWFKELGQKLAATMHAGDFDTVLDAINVGLLGGIVALFTKFFKSGFKLDLGGGLFTSITNTFNELTGVLKDMQLQIKANVLLKIAEAIAILTASVLVLSLIDSVALTKALTAMAVGFGQLMAAFSVFTKTVSGPKAAASFTIMSTGLILLSTALLILSAAVFSLSKLSLEELGRGLAGITGILTILTVASKPLAANSKGMITAGIGLTAMAVALTILAGAVKIFSMMSLGELSQGLIAIATALGIIVLFMRLLPEGPMLISEGIAMVAIAVAINMLAGAVAIFGTMSWETIGKGMVGLAGSLLIIAGAMRLMPQDMILSAASLILVGIAITLIGKAVTSMAGMSWEEIAKGMVALAGSLLIIAGGMKLMEEALPGALALVVVAFGLKIFAGVLKTFAGISWGDLLKGLAGIAITLAVLGAAAMLLEPAIPLMIALGAALVVLGAGFALVGLGAMLLAKSFEILAKSGKAGLKAMQDIQIMFINAIPTLATALAKGLIGFIQTIADAAPILAQALGVLLSHILDTLVENIPKLFIVLNQLLDGLIQLLWDKGPQFIDVGLMLLVKLLEGIRDNIGHITDVVAEIIVAFLNSLASHIPEIVQAGINIVVKLIEGIASYYNQIITAGADAIISFVEGLGQNAERIVKAGLDAVIKFLEGISQDVVQFASAAADVITNFLNALAGVIRDKSEALRQAGLNLAFAIMDGFTGGFATKAREALGAIGDFVDKAKHAITHPWEIFSPSHFTQRLGADIMEGFGLGISNNADKAISSAESVIDQTAEAFNNALSIVTQSLGETTEFNPTITPVLDLTKVAKDASKISDYISTSDSLNPAFSYNQAKAIAKDQNAIQSDISNTEKSPGGVTFQQVINAPTQLSTSDIYKQTRNQITMAKEELSIP